MYGAVTVSLVRRRRRSHLIAMLKKFVTDDRGLETVEYAVMTALIVAAIVLSITALTTAISGRFGEVKTVIDGIG